MLAGSLWGISAREERQQLAQVSVQAARSGCQVDLDADPAAKTDVRGRLLITEVEPGDHYLHIRCPGEAELAYFISPRPNETVRIEPPKGQSQAASAARDPSDVAANQVELRRLVPQAVQFRAQGRLDEAVAAFRRALELDPENSDLHRELGITFLLSKEWKRARVEMIEAIRHDQTDADAHNGLGYALEKLGDLDEAVKEYRTATHLEPDDTTYRTHYLDALVKIAARQEKKK